MADEEYGVVQEGFKRKTREDIENDMKNTARNLFGDDINLKENSPLGLLITLISYALALVWKALAGVYNSAFLDTAVGKSLDYVGQYIGVKRKPAAKAVGEALFTGQADEVIPNGFRISTDTDPKIIYETTRSGIIEQDGTITLPIKAVEAGEDYEVVQNQLTEFINPSPFVYEVTNNEPTYGGQDRESDYEFRQRYKESITLSGASTIDAIRSAIYEVAGVRSVYIRENHTMDIMDGLPPKSIEAVVLGGAEASIGKAILDSKAAGIETAGAYTVDVQDNAGNNRSISFSRPTSVPIYVDVSLNISPVYPVDGDIQVERAIIKYIGGTDRDGNTHPGTNVGEKVIHSRIIGEIYKIAGIDDATVTIGTSDNPIGIANIDIAGNSVAETDTAKVDVIHQ
ncbi:baseplate J/gp47 family protein [Orenia marismortui]|uniref:baseplate J/gp47 family protein n=1 Tax=Orenia marismortui TaxID=46469 RepID=UPI00037A428A|nr:baseplate J/gp47 family protein [Orenia marismortui]